jgi:hypothetical protein
LAAFCRFYLSRVANSRTTFCSILPFCSALYNQVNNNQEKKENQEQAGECAYTNDWHMQHYPGILIGKKCIKQFLDIFGKGWVKSTKEIQSSCCGALQESYRYRHQQWLPSGLHTRSTFFSISDSNNHDLMHKSAVVVASELFLVVANAIDVAPL